MEVTFTLLSTVLALLTAGALVLHWHNSLEIDSYLSGQNKQGLLPDQADIARR